MARAVVGWSLDDLAEKSGVSGNTIHRYENGKDAKNDTLMKIREALEAEGVVFTPATDTLEPGVALRKDRPKP